MFNDNFSSQAARDIRRAASINYIRAMLVWSFLFIVLFIGEPDLHGALIHHLMK